MNPYPKGIGDAVVGGTAPTSAGKLGTHFNSPYMKAMSQNLMTAIYGSPQDELTRSRIAQSKLAMETQRGENDAASAEAQRQAALKKAIADNDPAAFRAAATPEENINMFANGGGGRGGSGGSGRGRGGSGRGNLSAMDIGRYQERAQGILEGLVDENELKHLDYQTKALMMNDIVSQLADGNQIPTLPGFKPRSSSGWTDWGNNNVDATYQPMYSGDYLANSGGDRFVSNWERIQGIGFGGTTSNGQPVLGSSPAGGGGLNQLGGGGLNQLGGVDNAGGGNPLVEYSPPGQFSSALRALPGDLLGFAGNTLKRGYENVSDVVGNAVDEMQKVGWDGAVDITYDEIGAFVDRMQQTGSNSIDSISSLLSQGGEMAAPYIDQVEGYATQADNYLTNTAGPKVRELLQQVTVPGYESVAPYVQKADDYLTNEAGPAVRGAINSGAESVRDAANFAAPHIVNGVRNSPYGEAASNAIDWADGQLNSLTAQLNRPNYSAITGPTGGESKLGNIFDDVVDAGGNVLDNVRSGLSSADDFMSNTGGPALANILETASTPGYEMMAPYAQQADQFLSDTAGPAVAAGLDTAGNAAAQVAGQAGDMISAGWEQLDTRQALKDTPDVIANAIKDGYSTLEPVYDAATGAMKWAAVNSPIGKLVTEYPAYAAQAQKERTFQLQGEFLQQNPGKRPPVEYMYPLPKGTTAQQAKEMGVPSGAFVIIDSQPTRVDY